VPDSSAKDIEWIAVVRVYQMKEVADEVCGCGFDILAHAARFLESFECSGGH